MKTGIDWTGKQTEIHVTYSAYLFVYIIFIAIGYIKLHQLTTQNNYRFICRHFFIFFLLFPSIFHMEFTCIFNNFISFWYMLLHNIVKWNFKISINKLEWSTRKKNIILHYFYVPMGWNEDKVVKPKNVDWKCFYYAINEENGKKTAKNILLLWTFVPKMHRSIFYSSYSISKFSISQRTCSTNRFKLKCS